MKKYKFSLPFRSEKIRITGEPIDSFEWDHIKSGQEIYAALKESLPLGSFESLEIEIITNIFYKRYDLEQLKKIKHFLCDSTKMSLENDSYFDSHKDCLINFMRLISLRGMSMSKGLEKAIETQEKDEEIIQEISDKTNFHNI